MPNRMEHIEPKMVETYNAADENLVDLIGVFEDLAEEHSEILALMKLGVTTVVDNIRRELYPQIRRQLLAHEVFELEEIYPTFAQGGGPRQLSAEHAEDAAEFDAAIRSLDSLDVDGQKWQTTFLHLMELFERHVELEEYEYFPAAQEILGLDQALQLQSRYVAARHAALGRRSVEH